MKKSLIVFLKYFFFWVAYFWLSNLVFLIFNFKLTKELGAIEILKILIIGTRMDLSMAGYLTVLPGILFSFSFLLKPLIITNALKIYTFIVLVVAGFLNILDLGLYPHWGTRVGIDAFNYVNDFKGVVANVTLFDLLKATLLFVFYMLFFLKLFHSKIYHKTNKDLPIKWYYFPVMLFITACLIIPIRGSFNTAPMNSSFVSFSDKHYVNQAATNYMWNFFKTVERRDSYTNPCLYFDSEKANNIFFEVENNRINPDTAILKSNLTKSPNVILVILESFSNKVISGLGGGYNVSPNLDKICENSIVFTNFYASGNRSDRGISALLGGYPSLLEVSIMRFPDKAEKLTLISDHFNQNNYKTSFYYGGDIDFYHLKSFLLQGEYDEIVSQADFPFETRNLSKWGVPDEYLYDKVLKEVGSGINPFFKVVYTISSHPPYDVPFEKIKGNSNEAKYLNSVAYADSCLGAFIADLKKTKLWDNTLVIITSDHGYVEPGPTEISDPATYRIPLIWTGGVVGEHAVIDNISGQSDLMPTIVRQFGWKNDSSLFGHDIFSTPSYAFYMHDSGWGYLTGASKYFYNRQLKKFRSYGIDDAQEVSFDFAKAYLQVLHDDFLAK